MKYALTFLLLSTMLAAPLSARASDNSFWGTTMGATLGGYVGSTIGKGAGKLAATGAGVFLGGAIGNSIGHSMDRRYSTYASPRVYNYDAYRPSFDSYRPTYVAPTEPSPRIIYVQPQIIEYRQNPTPTFIEEGYVGPPAGEYKGRHCREFTQTIKIDGQTHESYGTACMRPDGSWQIVP